MTGAIPVVGSSHVSYASLEDLQDSFLKRLYAELELNELQKVITLLAHEVEMFFPSGVVFSPSFCKWVNERNSKYNITPGDTLLTLASREECDIRILAEIIEKYPHLLNQKNPYDKGKTPLHLVCDTLNQRNGMEEFLWLISKGNIEINVLDAENQTPLDYVVRIQLSKDVACSSNPFLHETRAFMAIAGLRSRGALTGQELLARMPGAQMSFSVPILSGSFSQHPSVPIGTSSSTSSSGSTSVSTVPWDSVPVISQGAGFMPAGFSGAPVPVPSSYPGVQSISRSGVPTYHGIGSDPRMMMGPGPSGVMPTSALSSTSFPGMSALPTGSSSDPRLIASGSGTPAMSSSIPPAPTPSSSSRVPGSAMPGMQPTPMPLWVNTSDPRMMSSGSSGFISMTAPPSAPIPGLTRSGTSGAMPTQPLGNVSDLRQAALGSGNDVSIGTPPAPIPYISLSDLPSSTKLGIQSAPTQSWVSTLDPRMMMGPGPSGVPMSTSSSTSFPGMSASPTGSSFDPRLASLGYGTAMLSVGAPAPVPTSFPGAQSTSRSGISAYPSSRPDPKIMGSGPSGVPMSAQPSTSFPFPGMSALPTGSSSDPRLASSLGHGTAMSSVGTPAPVPSSFPGAQSTSGSGMPTYTGSGPDPRMMMSSGSSSAMPMSAPPSAPLPVPPGSFSRLATSGLGNATSVGTSAPAPSSFPPSASRSMSSMPVQQPISNPGQRGTSSMLEGVPLEPILKAISSSLDGLISSGAFQMTTLSGSPSAMMPGISEAPDADALSGISAPALSMSIPLGPPMSFSSAPAPTIGVSSMPTAPSSHFGAQPTLTSLLRQEPSTHEFHSDPRVHFTTPTLATSGSSTASSPTVRVLGPPVQLSAESSSSYMSAGASYSGGGRASTSSSYPYPAIPPRASVVSPHNGTHYSGYPFGGQKHS